MNLHELKAILDGPFAPGPRGALLAQALGAMPDLGEALCLDVLMRAPPAHYCHALARHLRSIPTEASTRHRALEVLLQRDDDGAGAACYVCEEISEAQVARVVQAFGDWTDFPNPWESILFDVAAWRPSLIRAHRSAITDEAVLLGSLCGDRGPVAARLIADLHAGASADRLATVARLRTVEARAALLEILAGREELDQEERAALEALGVSADGTPAWHGRSCTAYLLPGAAGPHPLQCTAPRAEPVCLRCGTPAAALVTFVVAALPFPLATGQVDPELEIQLSWYRCGCDNVGPLYFRHLGATREVLVEPVQRTAEGSRLFAAPASVVLRDSPNPLGLTVPLAPGGGLHFVGGPPPFVPGRANHRCPVCARSAPFLALLDSGETPVGPAPFKGRLWIHHCGVCSVSVVTRERA